ncbi:MAG TPA: hypothetical protein VIK20_05725 [Bacteroidales bacterium]
MGEHTMAKNGTVKEKKAEKKIKCRNLQVFRWSSERKKAAFLLSLGTKTVQTIAHELNVSDRSIYTWKESPAFQAEIEKHVLKNEHFTRAGLLKMCLKGLSVKQSSLQTDRSTFLDFIKEIAELQGFNKQNLEIAGMVANVDIEITDEDRQEILCRLLPNRSGDAEELAESAGCGIEDIKKRLGLLGLE